MKRLAFLIVALLLMSVAIVSAQGGPPAGVATHIIVFNRNVNTRAAVPEVANAYGLQVTNVYEHALNGMAAVVPAGRLNALARDPRVAYVEANMEFHIAGIPTGLQRIDANVVALDIDGTDDVRVDVDVAVIDTGVDFQHPDLNVRGGVNCTGGGPFSSRCNSGGDDDHYHGTHVAGTIGALDNGVNVTVNGVGVEVVGVAPGARIWAVKVLNAQGSGYTSWIVAGIDWVVAQGNIEVANMSLGGEGISTAYRTAIDNAVSRGVVIVVAAGNSDANANNYSPAYVPNAITVSALADFDGQAGGTGAQTCRVDQDDTLADFSNWGSAVDIAAPGVCITSTYPIEQGNYGTISGTSMAAPHVAGAAALLASNNNPNNATGVTAIRNQLVNSGTFDWVDDSGDNILEPLLNIAGITPTFVASGGGGGGGGCTHPNPRKCP
jgi:subtilisin